MLVAQWYTGKKGRALAMAVTKYRQRDGRSHRDVPRLAHVEPTDRVGPMIGPPQTLGIWVSRS